MSIPDHFKSVVVLVCRIVSDIVNKLPLGISIVALATSSGSNDSPFQVTSVLPSYCLRISFTWSKTMRIVSQSNNIIEEDVHKEMTKDSNSQEPLLLWSHYNASQTFWWFDM